MRPHTVFGVCEGIGEDLGFNPVYLRILFAGGIYFAPAAVIGTYLFLGAAVAFARWAYPVAPAAALPAPQHAASANSDNEQLQIAA
jgi:phage shock protein PspC (stress-responsive transcriptional regulator)